MIQFCELKLGMKTFTRKQKRTRAPPGSEKIEHHHLLLRMETKTCPGPEDKEKAAKLITDIIHDIKMKLLGEPRV